MPGAKRRRLLIVDGYNVLNAWRPEVNKTDARTLSDARELLAERLMDYAGFSGQRVVLVYDAWMSDRAKRSEETRGPVSVVYTRKGETADHYIEKLCARNARDAELGILEMRVATSDRIEQTLILGRGATRLSARELLSEMEHTARAGRATFMPDRPARTTVMDRLDAETRRLLEKMRRGE